MSTCGPSNHHLPRAWVLVWGDVDHSVLFSRVLPAALVSPLIRYTCVALAGVVTEYLRFGEAEGGLGDVEQLDGMFRALQVG